MCISSPKNVINNLNNTIYNLQIVMYVYNELFSACTAKNKDLAPALPKPLLIKIY